MSTWKKLSSKIIHENPWWKVRHDRVLRPDGKEGDYFYADARTAPAIIAEEDDGKIWLARQHRYTISTETWEIIAGTIDDADADDLAAAKRELEEEAGLIANKWVDLGIFHASSGISNEKFHIFYASKLKQTKKHLDPTESDLAVTPKTLSEINTLITRGELTCAPSMAALYKYRLYKKNL